MTFDDKDFVHGLDAEHIRQVCIAATRDTSADNTLGDTVNVTSVGDPPRVYVTANNKPRTALAALRRVGYDAEPENPHSIAVRGWSVDRLTARVNALHAAHARLTQELRGAAARAIDIAAVDALNDPYATARQSARDAARQVGDLLRHEITTITGPHVPHDPHVRPHGQAARLVREAGELEDAIAVGIARSEYVATRAVERYIGYLAGPHPVNVPGHKAIRNALRDLRRRDNNRPAVDDPTAIAAADHPGDGPMDAPAIIPPRTPEPTQPQQTRGRTA